GVMTSYWANAVPFEGHLYGLSGEFDKRIDLNCVEIKTGKLKWSRKAFGKGALIIADGHLFITTKTGDLVLARATRGTTCRPPFAASRTGTCERTVRTDAAPRTGPRQ